MDLICFDNAGVEQGLTLDSTYQDLVKSSPNQPDTIIRVKDNTGRIKRFRRNRFIELNPQCCHDCGSDTLRSPRDYYMVHDDVWAQYGLGSQSGMLCMNCLEIRMGQPLQAHQIMLCPLNVAINPYTQQILWAYYVALIQNPSIPTNLDSHLQDAKP